MTARRWRAEFSAAASTFDWATLNRLSREFVKALYASPAPHNAVDAVLQLLRENLRYEEVEEVADAALAFGPGSAAIRRQYAQALVDGGNPAVALILYESITTDNTSLDRDRIDARGGMGRCYKELFVACTDPGRRRDYLLKAFHAYHDVYAKNPSSTYHGINAAALLARAERENITLTAGTPRSASIAEAVLDMLDTDPVPDMWNAVTAAEACVALRRHDEAVERAEAFLHSGPRGFTVASFLRQLQAVWQLDTSSPPGDQLLPVLRSALLSYKGGQVTVESGDVRAARLTAMEQDSHLEAVLGHDRYRSYRWYVNGLTRCRAVARIQTRYDDGVGTGFLAAGPDLHPDLPPLVVVTNGHVVPERLEIDDGVAAFHGLDADPGRNVALQIARICWYEPSTPPGLDTTILELTEYPTDITPVPLARKLPRLSVQAPPRAYLIGHPRGLATPQFSLQDNLLLDHDDRYLHYRSPSEPGSSGSPVFNDHWELIGIHHAGGFDLPRLNGQGGTHSANEGVTLPAIRARLAERPPNTGP
jgi:hypothetical protein